MLLWVIEFVVCVLIWSFVIVEVSSVGMVMKVIFYNFQKYCVVSEFVVFVGEYDLDIFCLQECDVLVLFLEIGDLVFVDVIQGNCLGLVLFYCVSIFYFQVICMLGLKKLLYDCIVKLVYECVLGVRFCDIDDGQDFIVVFFYVVLFMVLNLLCCYQICVVFMEFVMFGDGLLQFMVGDYNYLVFKESFGQVVCDYGYVLFFSDDYMYMWYWVFCGYYDFVIFFGFEIECIMIFLQGLSDYCLIFVMVKFD